MKSSSIIGKGSSATVFLVKDQNLYYAVKQLKRRKESKKEYVKRISQEFCIGSCLDHEHIVKTIDLFYTRSRDEWSLVMEYCSGGDMLREILSRELSLKECNNYFKQVMDGVRYMCKYQNI
jgi:serine/threonine protein kinase